MKIIVYLLTGLIFLSVFAGCNNRAADDDEERTIRLIYSDWSEGIALTNLAAVLLRDRMDYEVELKMTDVASVYEELSEGNYDVFPDAWLPKTQQEYYNQYKEDIEQISIIFPEAKTGLVVPEYSKYKSIEDLRNNTLPIVGIETNAGIMLTTNKAIQSYNLPVNLMDFSEDQMIEQLVDSIRRRNEIVVTGWDPHWVFARYEIRFLEDPMNIYGDNENIYVLGRKGLEEDHPNVVRFFERMQLSEKQINSLIYAVQTEQNPVEGVEQWIDKNEYVVNQWIKGLTPERIKIM